MAQIIKRALLISFDTTTYTASILLLEATSTVLSGVPLAFHMDGTSLLANGSLCAVLFFDENNSNDAVILAVYSTGSAVPTPPPGRTTFVTGSCQIANAALTAGTVYTYTLAGGASPLPGGALGVLYKAFFSSASTSAYIQMAPHGASDLGAYITLGNLNVASATVNSSGILPVDGNGRADIKALNGNCSLTLYTYGYVQ